MSRRLVCQGCYKGLVGFRFGLAGVALVSATEFASGRVVENLLDIVDDLIWT